MIAEKADIIARLKKELLMRPGFKPVSKDNFYNINLGPINESFPDHQFPLAATHEFLFENAEQKAASFGFISCLISPLAANGAVVWINPSRLVFPPALKFFGIDPDKVVFIDIKNEKDRFWVIEETLKCEGLAAVIAEIKDLSFNVSRRLQLTVEQSRVTGFIIRQKPRIANITACLSRWKISSQRSFLENNLPGVGFPCWNIELLKIRNGKPGAWQMEWSGGNLHPVNNTNDTLIYEAERKVG